MSDRSSSAQRADRLGDMAIPDVIPIRRIAGYRTDTIGRYDGGQFFAYVTGASPRGTFHAGWDWRAHKPWYAVLHRFDHAGAHLASSIHTPGLGIRDGLAELLVTWLNELPGREYCDIAIRPFELIYDDTRFGLVLESHGDYPEGATELDWAELYPGRLGFSCPWNGRYDT
jgi:formate hydrogenlyase regulatory protein HycA